MNAAVYKSDGDLNERGHKRAVGLPGVRRSAASVSVIERGSGNSSFTTSPAGGDDEGRHGSSKWCSPWTPCQLLGEARKEIWHGSVLSTERIIGRGASSPATSGVLRPGKFWSSAAERGVSGKYRATSQTCWWERIVTEGQKGGNMNMLKVLWKKSGSRGPENDATWRKLFKVHFLLG